MAKWRINCFFLSVFSVNSVAIIYNIYEKTD